MVTPCHFRSHLWRFDMAKVIDSYYVHQNIFNLNNLRPLSPSVPPF